MIKFQLRVNLGAQIYADIELPLDKKIILGSSPECDVILQGDRVKNSHAELLVIDRQWHIQALDGEVRISGEVVDHVLVELNKPILIGPYVLQISLTQSDNESVFLKDSEEHKTGLADNVAHFFQSVFAKVAKVAEKIPGGKKLIALANHNFLKTLWLPEYRMRTVLVAVICVLGFWVFGGKGDGQQNTVVEKYDIQTMRDIQRYQSWVTELLDKNDYQQSLAILNAAIIKNPHIIELQQQRELVIGEYVDYSISSGKPELAKKTFQSLDDEALESPKVKPFIEKLDAILQEKKQHLANYEKNKKQFDSVISKVQAKMASGETEEAQFLLKDLSSVTEFESDWQLQVNQLQEQIQVGLSALEKQRRQEKLQAFEDRKLSMLLFSQCLNSYEGGDFMQAYADCRKAKDKSPVKELSAEVQVWLTVLEPMVTEQMNKWSANADECFKTGWIGCALSNWNKMLRNDPENIELLSRVEGVIVGQRKLALKMFNEARAYADHGRDKDALLLLSELQNQLPLRDEEMYQRAAAMIERLKR